MTPSPETLARTLAQGDRAALARAITLVESKKPEHREAARALLQACPAPSEPAVRIGISGPPGVGKSTFIEAFGRLLVDGGARVAVLAVDPSSVRTGGSIMADKTRMPELSRSPSAFVRPSPSGGSLGGVARRTRETMQLVEGAGYGIVLVETVGVGQSETAVAQMVDTFLLLMLSGAGDEVQGIKKGVLEWADVLAVTKADGGHEARAESAAAELRSALSILTPAGADWKPPVYTCSAREGTGLSELWDALQRHRSASRASGDFEERRRSQRVHWLRSEVEERVMEGFRLRAGPHLGEIQAEVESGKMTPAVGAARLLELANGR